MASNNQLRIKSARQNSAEHTHGGMAISIYCNSTLSSNYSTAPCVCEISRISQSNSKNIWSPHKWKNPAHPKRGSGGCQSRQDKLASPLLLGPRRVERSRHVHNTRVERSRHAHNARVERSRYTAVKVDKKINWPRYNLTTGFAVLPVGIMGQRRNMFTLSFGIAPTISSWLLVVKHDFGVAVLWHVVKGTLHAMLVACWIKVAPVPQDINCRNK